MNLSRARAFLVLLLLLAGVAFLRWQNDSAEVRGKTRLSEPSRVTSIAPERPADTAPAAPARERENVPGRPGSASERDAFVQFRDWSARYRSSSSEQRADLLADGLAKARARRAEMAKLIVENPRGALENAVPIVERQQLPPEIVELLEERISARGFYGVLGVVGAPVGEPSIRRELRLAHGPRYNAFVYGERLTQTTTENAVVHGVAVGRNVALHPRRVRPLETGEIPDATKRVFETCPVSKKSTAVARENGALPPVTEETPAVEIAGEVHYLCDGGHIRAIEEELVAGEGVSGGPVKPTTSIASTQSTGVRTLLYMRVAFPETNRDPQTETAAYEMMRQVNDYFLENSYGNVYLLTTVTPLLVLPRSEAWYNGGGGDEYDVRTDAQTLARQLGYDTGQYDLDIVAYNGGPGSFGGLGYVGGKGTWLKSITVGVACHELGHNFGLWHANFWDTGGTSTIGDGSNAEYGNSFDTMGNAGAGDLQFNAYHKSRLNWLDRQHFVHNITSSGTYRVEQFDQGKLDPGHRYAVRIRKDSDRDYWAEFRQKSLSNNRWTRDGVLLNWSSWAESNGGSHLLDTTPGSPDGKTDSALVIGRTFSDHSSGVHITPIGKAGSSPEAIDLVVNLGFFPGNQAPLATIAASAGTTAVNTPVSFTATAADPDGDPLSYAWDFGDRTFATNNAATASKAWTAAGDYVVRCVVSDMKGGTASDSLIVRVGSPATFRVSGQVRLGTQPLPNVRVHNGQTGSSYRGAYSDTDGSYTIAGIATGNITLTAALDGYSFAPSGFVNPLNVSANFSAANFNATELTQLTLSVIDPDCSEGAANPGRFRLSRTGATTSSLTVEFFTPSGTASRTSDYTLSPSIVAGDPYQTLVIPAGQSFIDITAAATDDTSAEGPEEAILEVVRGSGYVIAGSHVAALTIQDSDSALPVVGLMVVQANASENGGSATFAFTRSGATTAPLTVRYTATGSATSGSDYPALSGQLLIPAGASSALLTVAPLNDNAPEGSETVIISLSTNAAYIRSNDSAATSGTINIIDDDLASITVIASDPGATEVGSDPGIFLISRTGDTSQPLTVNYALSGSAHQGVDYAPVPGVLTIAAGSSVGTITIVPIDDGVGEPQQTVVLQIRGGIGYAVETPNSATVNINDNNDLPVVTVGVSDGSAGEPSSTGRFRFTTTGTGAGNIVVNYTVEGTATSGADYTAIAGTLSMGRNTTAEITITPINDSIAEGYETVTVTIDPDPAYTIHLDTSATLNLADDDQPIVSVSTTNDAFSEGSGTGRFWISRSGATTNALTVSYTMGGSATNGADYTSLPGTINIPAGAAGVAVNIAPINDPVVEGSESITLTLAPGAYGIGLQSATHYLADTETPAVQVRFASSSGSGTENVGAVNIAVNLSAATAVPVTVQYEIGGGSAIAGVDYALTPDALVFAPGETAKIIPLTITDDVYDEPAQTVIVRLQNATGAALGTSTHTYTINDNDNPPAAVIGFAGATSSGAESTSPAPIVVSLSAPQTGAVSIDYLAGSGSATSGDDYVLAGGRLTFAPGETAKIIPSTVINDSVLEPSETIVATISNPIGATLGAIVSHTYSILDDDAAAVTVVVNDAAAAENNDSGSFLFTRTGSLVNPLTANISVTGSAGNGTDYAALASTFDFAAGAATAEVTVTPLDDANGEGAETVTITVTSGAGYAVGNPNTAVLTIADDEPGVSIAASEPNAAELNAEPGVFTLTRSGSTAASLNVAVAFTGSAAAGIDYATLTSPVSIPAGASSATVTVVPVNDAAAEGAETVIATIGAGAGYFVAAPAVATVTIADDDINLPPEITVTSPAETSIGIPTGVGLILEATVSDDGKPLAPGRVTTTWSRVSGPAAVLFGNAAEATTTASFTVPGTYQLRLSATDGEFQAATVLSVVVGGNPSWTSQDVGAVGLVGSFADSNGTYTVRGAGANITGTGPDAFRFAFQQMNGDGEIRARVVSMVGGNSSAKAGVMFRNTVATNSRLAYMSLYGAANTSDDSSFRTRATDGGAMTTVSTDGQNAPYWVRVVRTGDIFSGYASADGESWTQIGSSQTVSMNAQVLVGLAVTSNNVAALTTAQFDNVSLSSWPANVGPDADAGSDLSVTLPSPGTLAGSAVDDGKPAPPGEVTTLWSALSGPGTVSFADPARLDTSATFSQPGLYVLRLIADDGAVKTFDDVSVSALRPLIGVQTTGPGASERGPVSGTFTFTRSGSTAFSLNARFTIGGTATAGTDYAIFGGTVTFPIGESSVLIELVPITDEISEGSENVILNVEPDPSYTIGSGSSATAVIADLPIDAWRYARFGVNANNPTIAGIQIDLDGDGLANLLEYAFATDPFSANAAAPIIERDGNDLTLIYRRPSEAADILYTVEEFGAGIGGWSPTAFSEEMIDDDGTVRLMKARVPIAGALEKTLRLRVTRN